MIPLPIRFDFVCQPARSSAYNARNHATCFRHQTRSLRDSIPARRGRHGRGVSRAGYAVGTHRRDQDFASSLFFRPYSQKRFEREAKTISNLNHPHICVLHDVGSQDGMDYLVMECVEGETLAKRLEKGPIPLEQVLKFGGQIADALDKAHRNGVVHRDLKPGNIMLTSTGAKLLDFGLAKPAVPLTT